MYLSMPLQIFIIIKHVFIFSVWNVEQQIHGDYTWWHCYASWDISLFITILGVILQENSVVNVESYVLNSHRLGETCNYSFSNLEKCSTCTWFTHFSKLNLWSIMKEMKNTY